MNCRFHATASFPNGAEPCDLSHLGRVRVWARHCADVKVFVNVANLLLTRFSRASDGGSRVTRVDSTRGKTRDSPSSQRSLRGGCEYWKKTNER